MPNPAAHVFQVDGLTEADLLPGADGKYLLVTHNLGTVQPLVMVYCHDVFEGVTRHHAMAPGIGEGAFRIFAVSANALHIYPRNGQFDDKWHVTVVG